MSNKDKNNDKRSTGRRTFMKGVGATLGTAVVGYGGNKYVPQENQIEGSAEAVVPAPFLPAVMGGGFMGVMGVSSLDLDPKEIYDNFFGGTEREPDKDTSGSTSSAVRESAHKEAISTAGYMQASTTDFSNDLNTLEGEHEQKLTRAINSNPDQYSSQSELVAYAETETSKNLWKGLKNPIEAWNFGSVDIRGVKSKLETAGFSGDLGAVTKLTPSGTLSDTPSGEYIKLDGDVTFDVTGTAFGGFSVLDLNGNTVTIGPNASYLTNLPSDQKVLIKNGSIDMNGSSSYVINADSSNSIDLINVDVDTSDASSDTVADGGSVYLENTNVSDSQISGTVVSESQFTGFSQNGDIDPVTFDPADISDTDLDATANFTRNEVDRALTAVEVPTASSYTNSEEAPLTLAVPYLSNTSEPVTNGDHTLVVETSTDGTAKFVEPLDYNRVYSLLQDRDGYADNIYASISTFAEGLWTDNNFGDYEDTETALQESDFNTDTGNFTPPNFDPQNPREVNSIYAGNYDTIKSPYDTVQTYRTADGQEITGVLWSTDLTAINGGASLISVGSTLDPSQTRTTFVVEDETGARYDLEEPFDVLGFERGGSQVADVEIRGYDYESTNLGDLGQRIEDKNNTIETIVNDSGGNGFFSNGIPDWMKVGGGAGGLYIAYESFINNDDDGKGGNGSDGNMWN